MDVTHSSLEFSFRLSSLGRDTLLRLAGELTCSDKWGLRVTLRENSGCNFVRLSGGLGGAGVVSCFWDLILIILSATEKRGCCYKI